MTKLPRRLGAQTDPEGEFPLDLITYVFHLFAVISRHREAKIDSLLDHLGLNVSRYRSLAVVQMLEPCSMTQLAEYTAIDRTTLTRIVDHMVESGLVERATPPKDRRQVLLTLTDKGRASCREAIRAIYRLNRDLLQGLSEAEQRNVARAFRRFVTNLVGNDALRARLLLQEDPNPKGRGL